MWHRLDLYRTQMDCERAAVKTTKRATPAPRGEAWSATAPPRSAASRSAAGSRCSSASALQYPAPFDRAGARSSHPLLGHGRLQNLPRGTPRRSRRRGRRTAASAPSTRATTSTYTPLPAYQPQFCSWKSKTTRSSVPALRGVHEHGHYADVRRRRGDAVLEPAPGRTCPLPVRVRQHAVLQDFRPRRRGDRRHRARRGVAVDRRRSA